MNDFLPSRPPSVLPARTLAAAAGLLALLAALWTFVESPVQREMAELQAASLSFRAQLAQAGRVRRQEARWQAQLAGLRAESDRQQAGLLPGTWQVSWLERLQSVSARHDAVLTEIDFAPQAAGGTPQRNAFQAVPVAVTAHLPEEQLAGWLDEMAAGPWIVHLVSLQVRWPAREAGAPAGPAARARSPTAGAVGGAGGRATARAAGTAGAAGPAPLVEARALWTFFRPAAAVHAP